MPLRHAGLDTAWMQNDQPVAYASTVLIPPEVLYAQIERELLATMFACNHFEFLYFSSPILLF